MRRVEFDIYSSLAVFNAVIHRYCAFVLLDDGADISNRHSNKGNRFSIKGCVACELLPAKQKKSNPKCRRAVELGAGLEENYRKQEKKNHRVHLLMFVLCSCINLSRAGLQSKGVKYNNNIIDPSDPKQVRGDVHQSEADPESRTKVSLCATIISFVYTHSPRPLKL